jgi:hypothetical protein
MRLLGEAPANAVGGNPASQLRRQSGVAGCGCQGGRLFRERHCLVELS